MKLETFRIINCSGFGDSGKIELRDENNLIYVLGRNSSGKTSLLKSVRSFGHDLVPQELPNFRNFDSDLNEDARLEATYSVRAKLTLEKFETDLASFLESQGFGEAAIGHRPNEEFRDTILSIYGDLIKRINANKRCLITKYFDGDYLFEVDENDTTSDQRVKAIRELRKKTVNDQGLFFGGSSWQKMKITAYSAEAILFNQFPRIALFDEQFALSDNLPNTIAKDWKANSNGLTQSFISYLGEGKVEELLVATVPSKIRLLEEQLNDRALRLVGQLNAGRARAKEKLLGVTILFSSDGLQITVFTDEKPSYYSQLSDNTKFLFAYHLHQASSAI